MKRFTPTSLILVGRSVVGGGSPAQPNPTGAQPIRSSDRAFIQKMTHQREWREKEDAAIEAEQQEKHNSNKKIPATFKYNENPNGYGLKRRLRVSKGDLDAKDFQSTMDKSQLSMNFK
eukprot:GILI01024963.1.p1 GENE.GILI01024963.1~~GILI01024963.1.p1  ORF type:complete len:125 (+),score=22.74 GILI01024963.1:22-375(+)